jgi:hypothetical protein
VSSKPSGRPDGKIVVNNNSSGVLAVVLVFRSTSRYESGSYFNVNGLAAGNTSFIMMAIICATTVLLATAYS